VQQLIKAKYPEEVIFVKGTTEAINLVAESYGRKHLKPGDEVVITAMEHHSNWVPWQYICQETGAILKIVPLKEDGSLDLSIYEKLLSPKTQLVAITHISNVLGTINPVKKMTQMAHAQNAIVLLDGAQAVAHTSVNVQDLNCDFYTFSGHKMYGPTGIGVLYGKMNLLEKMEPYQRGGGMIEQVTAENTSYAALPNKFEAGTPHIAGAVALSSAIQYLEKLNLNEVTILEESLLKKATEVLCKIKRLRIIGEANEKAAVISFISEQVHPHDMATILDSEGIAVRAGHHCAMPLMDFFGIPATVRVSFGVYNTWEEIELLGQAIEKAIALLTK
jgi:cysteine desulfurase / selenocysteine lyase